MKYLRLLHESASAFADYMLKYTSKRKVLHDRMKWVVCYDRMLKHLEDKIEK